MKSILRLLVPTALSLAALGAPARAADLSVAYAQRFGATTLSLGYGHPNGHGQVKRFGFSYAGYAPCPPRRTWVAGCWKTVEQQVWVPASWDRVWVEPVYRTCFDPCRQPYRVLVCAGHWQSIGHPGHYETKLVQVFEPGHWVQAPAYACG